MTTAHRVRFVLFSLLLAFGTAVGNDAGGHLLIIGGGSRPDTVMQRFVELAGGADARVVVVPYASGDPADVGDYQANQIREFGTGWVTACPPDSNAIDSADLLALFDGATGIFLSGGDQRRLTRLLLGTAALDSIRAVYARGGVVGGTSAGAAVMSEIMITGDEALSEDDRPFATIQAGNVITTPGFGFLTDVIIDQHFVRRSRHNRLISLVLEHPQLLGIGIDERTAIHVNGEAFNVLGDGTVVVYDASSIGEREVRQIDSFMSASNIRMHLLLAGDRFNMKTRQMADR